MHSIPNYTHWTYKLKLSLKFLGERIRAYWGLDDWIALIIFIIGILFYWENGPLPYNRVWDAIYTDIHTEMIGIGITIIFLGNANQYIQRQTEKRNLIIQMGSTDHGLATGAVAQLRDQYWLFDGSLIGADLMEAHLEGVDLVGAHLEGADLVGAHLERTDLLSAHLEEADLWKAHLEGASLVEAHLEGADLVEAHLEGADLVEAYLHGADLVAAHLEEANLQGACLEEASLLDATFNDDTDWRGATYSSGDNGTIWPDNAFDPVESGCIEVIPET
jgi:hypothetical protein